VWRSVGRSDDGPRTGPWQALPAPEAISNPNRKIFFTLFSKSVFPSAPVATLPLAAALIATDDLVVSLRNSDYSDPRPFWSIDVT